jgi:hypothetical protein
MDSFTKQISLSKKDYSAPRVIEYGEVRKLTAKSGSHNDGLFTKRMG